MALLYLLRTQDTVKIAQNLISECLYSKTSIIIIIQQSLHRRKLCQISKDALYHLLGDPSVVVASVDGHAEPFLVLKRFHFTI